MGTPVFKTLNSIIETPNRFDINKITFFTKTIDGTLIVPDTDVFLKYMKVIENLVTTYKVTEAQRERYRYRPYLLSTDIYGTPELGWLLMRLNGQECASKFRIKKTIRVIPYDSLVQIYDNIVANSYDNLTSNWTEYSLSIT